MPKKVKRIQRAKRSSGKIWLACSAFLIAGITAYFAISSQKSRQERLAVATIRVEDWVMSAEDAYNYLRDTVGPILTRYANDTSELPALHSRILKFAQLVGSQEIEYQAMPAFYPPRKTILAKIDFNPDTNKLMVVVFVPALQQAQHEMDNKGKSAKDREDALAIYYAHEIMHIEEEGFEGIRSRAGRTDLQAMQTEAVAEARVWCKTIIELVRPMAEQGRRPLDNMIFMSEQLKRVNDNCSDPAWIRVFQAY